MELSYRASSARITDRDASSRQRSGSLITLWWRYLKGPLVTFLPLAVIFGSTNIDPAIARALFYDSSAHSWIGAGVIWVEALIHSGGRLLIGVLLSASLCIWMVARLNPQISELRRPATYFSLSVILSIGCIALLKLLTNVHCPWSLEVFGGHYPYIELFSPRPQALKTGQCFPAAHASCGYALLALFFVFRERSRRLARTGIVVAILAGLLFGISQQSRGAHFLSHDVWSAFIVWAIAASLYVFAFRARLWRDNI